jgi:hypothetical protein
MGAKVWRMALCVGASSAIMFGLTSQDTFPGAIVARDQIWKNGGYIFHEERKDFQALHYWCLFHF